MDTHERIHLISAKTDAEVEVTVVEKWLKKKFTVLVIIPGTGLEAG